MSPISQSQHLEMPQATLKLEGEQAVLQGKPSGSQTCLHQQLPRQLELDQEAPVTPQ